MTRRPHRTDMTSPAPGRRARLSLRAPALAGVGAVAILAALVGIAGRTPFEKSVGTAGMIVAETQTTTVRHARGGRLAQFHVALGQKVAVGDVLATLDTQALGSELATLRQQAEQADEQLASIRQQVAAIVSDGEPAPDMRARLTVERQLVTIEKDGVGLTRRSAIVEQELARAVVRAPVTGQISRLAPIAADGVLEPGAVLAEIAPPAGAVAIIASVPVGANDNIAPGTPVRVWPLAGMDARPLRGRVVAIAPSTQSLLGAGPASRMLRIDLAEPHRMALTAGLQARLTIATGTHFLLDELIEPLLRLLNRASRA